MSLVCPAYQEGQCTGTRLQRSPQADVLEKNLLPGGEASCCKERSLRQSVLQSFLSAGAASA